MDFELEQCYKNKVFQLEREIKDLKSEYECGYKVEDHMAEQISAQKRIIEKRNAVIRKYVDKYGLLDDAEDKKEFERELSDAYKRIRKEFENAPDYIKEYYNNNFATSKHAKKLPLKIEIPDVSLGRKINMELSENEYRALEVILDHGISVCSGGCIYEEMQETQVICDDCDFTKARNTLEVLFGLIGDEYL